MMFGMGPDGETNLITRALAAVGRKIDTLPDPTQVHYHLPRSAAHTSGLEVKVWRAYEDFANELVSKFPHEERGIRAFYGECWRVFNALNSLELKSLEEPRYLLQQFARDPLACLTLASFLITNCGDVARRHIRDPELLKFIDAECYIWSTVLADDTPMVNAGMVFCDRHYGGINYPKGGVGTIAEAMAAGLEERYPFVSAGGGGGGSGSSGVDSTAKGALVVYKAPVSEILLERDPEATAADGTAPGYRACGVRLADGREFRARSVVSNATRWDTFERLLLRENGGGGRSAMAAPDTPEAAEMRAASAALEAEEKKAKQQQQHNAATTLPSLPETEKAFRRRFRKAPSFVSLHVGVDAGAVPKDADVHHIVIEDWGKMEEPRGTLFVSVPTL
jgi:prolycopene isomerase